MTEHRPINPLTARQPASYGSGTGPAYFTCKETGETLSTDIDDTCARLNARDPRRGKWVVITIGDEPNKKKTVDFIPEVASDDWLRENGFGALGRRIAGRAA